MTIRDGGYVQSSNVQVQQDGASEATLALRLPSARLGAELAALARLTPVREETQSRQDITGSYNAARRALSDAEAERRALLRALAAATTEGQIASLRERLGVARAAIVRAQGAFNAILTRASTAEVEVSIVGDEKAGAEGLAPPRAARCRPCPAGDGERDPRRSSRPRADRAHRGAHPGHAARLDPPPQGGRAGHAVIRGPCSAGGCRGERPGRRCGTP